MAARFRQAGITDPSVSELNVVMAEAFKRLSPEVIRKYMEEAR